MSERLELVKELTSSLRDEVKLLHQAELRRKIINEFKQLESENERLREVLKEIRELETSRLGDDVLRSDVGWMADEALRGDTE